MFEKLDSPTSKYISFDKSFCFDCILLMCMSYHNSVVEKAKARKHRRKRRWTAEVVWIDDR
jgi:hypothetical protein